jgi:hypothetical protein
MLLTEFKKNKQTNKQKARASLEFPNIIDLKAIPYRIV